MPKVKTRKAVKKRVKKTGTGKIMRYRSGKAHLQGKKRGNRKRRLSNKKEVTNTHKKKLRRMLKS